MDWKTLLFSFTGRIDRGGWWTVYVLGLVVGFVLRLVLPADDAKVSPESAILLLLILTPVLFLSVWVSLAVNTKRWHDRDKSGWWNLILLIPIVGAIWVFIENGFLKGTEGPNSFGPESQGLPDREPPTA